MADTNIAEIGSWRSLRNIVIKAFILFVVINVMFSFAKPMTALGRISGYNFIFPGRVRFPFGENPTRAYNLSLYNLDAMFASHKISAENEAGNEFRVLVIGDSSVWGTLLKPEDTLSGQINQKNLRYCGNEINAYNLGYPTLSLMKDLMVLEEGMKYKPDMIIWLMTLEAFPWEKQLESPIVANNAGRINILISEFGLPLEILETPTGVSSVWSRSVIGERRALADLARLQMYGVLWSATGIDQEYPEEFTPAKRDFEENRTFHGWAEGELQNSELAFDVIQAGLSTAGDIPVLIVNEPILISDGQNSDIRYNFFYPRWAYDSYRSSMHDTAETSEWNYLDLWNLVPETEFTNSAIHLPATGVELMAEQVIRQITNSMDCK